MLSKIYCKNIVDITFFEFIFKIKTLVYFYDQAKIRSYDCQEKKKIKKQEKRRRVNSIQYVYDTCTLPWFSFLNQRGVTVRHQSWFRKMATERVVNLNNE